jgi:hypothetical protein
MNSEQEALHAAFQEYIKEQFTDIDCYNESTLDRNDNGTYTNMSVRLEWPVFVRGWKAGRSYR